MTIDPRSALNRLIAALESHLDAASSGDPFSPALISAETAVQDAFFTYDDALFTAYDIELPLDLVDTEDDSEDDDDEDFDDFLDDDDDLDDEDDDESEDDDSEDLDDEDLEDED